MIKSTDLNKKLRPLIMSVFALMIICFVTEAQAQQDINSRLSRIENEISTLSRAIFKGETPPPSLLGQSSSNANSANTELRLQQIELEIRSLTGKLEEQNYLASQADQQLEAQILELRSRIEQLEVGSSAAIRTAQPVQQVTSTSTAVETPSLTGGVDLTLGAPASQGSLNASDMVESPSSDGLPTNPVTGQLGTLRQSADSAVPEGAVASLEPALGIEDPVSIYEEAFSYLRDRSYDQAETSFSSFLKRYPKHELASNAKYWLGETFYVRNNYERAAREFAEAYQQYPKGTKGPDNLLKLGMSLAGLGKTNDACITFSQLKKDYPSGAAPILMRAEQEMAKLNCTSY